MHQTIDSILVPTDGSEGAMTGARRGIDLAAATGADVHVLSVIDTREIEPSLSHFDAEDRAEPEQLFKDEAKRAVDTVTGLAQTHLSGMVTGTIRRGIPSREIVDYVESHEIDLVVMGTHGRTGLKRLLLGSVAEKTLRTASVPIVAVPPSVDRVEPGAGEYENILLPTDSSEGAEIAVGWGLAFADVYDATVHTVYSTDTRRFVGAGDMAAIHDALERVGRDALDYVQQQAQAADISVAGYIGSGPAARVILAYGDDHDIDMIVMGTHGRSGIKRYLIGSVTETVVHNADVPVCCVPMADAEAAEE